MSDEAAPPAKDDLPDLPERTCPQCGGSYTRTCRNCTDRLGRGEMPHRSEMQPEERTKELELLLSVRKTNDNFYPYDFWLARIRELVGRHVEFYDIIANREGLLAEAREDKPAPRK